MNDGIDRTTPEFLARMMLYIDGRKSVIEQNGYIVQSVMPSPEMDQDDMDNYFSYTVGLCTKGLPELIIYGVDSNIAGDVLEEFADDLLGGMQLGDFEGVEFREVEDSREHLTLANRLYGVPNPVRALEILFNEDDECHDNDCPGCNEVR